MAKALLNKILSTRGFISLLMTVGYIVLAIYKTVPDTYQILYTVVITFYFGNEENLKGGNENE